MASPLIKGFCPACGMQTLHLQVDTIQCWNPDCKRPDAAHLLLMDDTGRRWSDYEGDR
jgi:hypothetical protein